MVGLDKSRGPWSAGPPVPWSSGPLVFRGFPTASGLVFGLAAGRPGHGPQSAACKELGAGLANEIYDACDRRERGLMKTHDEGRGVFKICDEPRSPNEGACLGCVMNLNGPIGGGGVLKIYHEPESPHEGACFLSFL